MKKTMQEEMSKPEAYGMAARALFDVRELNKECYSLPNPGFNPVNAAEGIVTAKRARDDSYDKGVKAFLASSPILTGYAVCAIAARRASGETGLSDEEKTTLGKYVWDSGTADGDAQFGEEEIDLWTRLFEIWAIRWVTLDLNWKVIVKLGEALFARKHLSEKEVSEIIFKSCWKKERDALEKPLNASAPNACKCEICKPRCSNFPVSEERLQGRTLEPYGKDSSQAQFLCEECINDFHEPR